MKPLADIRSLYHPLQPTIRQTAEEVVYHEQLPALGLQPYIYCYWQLRTTQTLQQPFLYRVVADGCIDIFFDLNQPQDNFVMGFCSKFTEFPLENSFNFVGIRFLPSMFPQLFKVNASEFSNRFEQLGAVLPATAAFIQDHFDGRQSLEECAALLDNYFLHYLQNISLQPDTRLYAAIELILQHSGGLDVEKELDIGLSSRQLRRLFEFYIGDTAKTFSQIIRFQTLLRANPSAQNLRKNKIFFDAGYFDQSHFIKEFKNFYGVTPTQAFGQ